MGMTYRGFYVRHSYSSVVFFVCVLFYAGVIVLQPYDDICTARFGGGGFLLINWLNVKYNINQQTSTIVHEKCHLSQVHSSVLYPPLFSVWNKTKLSSPSIQTLSEITLHRMLPILRQSKPKRASRYVGTIRITQQPNWGTKFTGMWRRVVGLEDLSAWFQASVAMYMRCSGMLRNIWW
jgi:hypothetical protein